MMFRVCILLLVVSSVRAQDGDDGDLVESRKQDDINQLGLEEADHEPTHEEAIQLLVKHFEAIDTNGDGKINYNELDSRYRAHMDRKHQTYQKDFEDMAQQQFENADTDGDGQLNKKEHAVMYDADIFDIFDLDGDGKLDFKE
jgi:Ca2+-binding EF-hand superfamily protein